MDIASAGERRVGIVDRHRRECGATSWILCPVDKTEQITLVEIFEPMNLIDDSGAAAQPVHDLSRDLEAQIHLRGADVEEEIARGRHCVVPLPVDLRK